MNRNVVILILTGICFLLLMVIFTYVRPTVNQVTDAKVLQPRRQTLKSGITYFSKFNRHIPADQDVNCVSTIPENLVETSKESPIIIPRKEVLQKLELNALNCIYHRYLQTLQRHCTQPTRVGNLGKGGWNVCTDPGAVPKQPCLVYSFSDKENYGSFAMEMAQSYKCRVHLYNSNPASKVSVNGVEYNNTTLDGNNGMAIASLRKMIDNQSDTKGNVNVLTLDINNREWDVLPKMLQSGILGRVEQLSIRLHGATDTFTIQDYIDRLVVLRDVYNTGFRIFWTDRVESCLQKKRKATGCYFINMIRVMNRPTPLVIPSDPEFNNMKRVEYGNLFLRYVTSVQIPCKEIIRVGKIQDGGWDVCHDAVFRPSNSCLVYSFGINNDFSFDDDVANTYGCEVKSFDPSMKSKDHQHAKKVMFYATGIANHNGNDPRGKGIWRMRTLQTIMKELGHSKRKIDILKMDVEASEWSSMPEMITSGVLKNVKQFAFELHPGNVQDDANIYKNALKMLRNLYKVGFRIFWTHRNLHCAFRTKTGKQRTACYEVYTVNTNTNLNL